MEPHCPLVEMENVTKKYESGAAPLRVLDGLNFTLHAGQCAAITGPSGCGKSTLLHLMGALDAPTSGVVRMDGRDIGGLTETEAARLRNREIGFVFQSHHLLPQCTALENVLAPSLVHPDGRNARGRALTLLARVGLGDKAQSRPGQLSGGERQRVAAVRALINRPRLLLADEPTGSLNEAGAAQLADLLLELARDERMAMVIVTHAQAIAARFGTVYALHGGHLELAGGA